MIRHSLSGPGGDTRGNGEECEIRGEGLLIVRVHFIGIFIFKKSKRGETSEVLTRAEEWVIVNSCQ
jgi:hypothetical protein